MRSHPFKNLSKGFLIVVVLATMEGIFPNDSQCSPYVVGDARMAVYSVFQGLSLPVSDGDEAFTRWNSPLGTSSEDRVYVHVELSPPVPGTTVPEHKEYLRLTPRSPPRSLV